MNELMSKVAEIAIDNLKTDKRLAPTLVVEGKRGNAIIGLDFSEDKHKIASMEFAGRKIASLIPTAVVLVSEAWVSQTLPSEGKRVADNPDRQECISLIYQSRLERTTQGCIIPFTRVGSEVILGETKMSGEGDYIESRLLLFFWVGVLKGLTDLMGVKDASN